MIHPDIIQVLHQLFLGLSQGFWYALENNHQHLPTVLATTHLNEFQYETLLLRSGILFKHGQFNRVSYNKLDYLTTTLQQQYNMDFLATPTKFNNRNTVSVVIVRALYNNPSRQLRANVNVPVVDRKLPYDGNLQLINRLCEE
jgi:hypothetical protein